MNDEQTICITCGFCCDGTMFLFACLHPGEKGGLPEEIEKKVFSEKDEDFFRLPCNYFSEKCTIYDRPRAGVCGEFRCQLLHDFTDGKVTLCEALKIVKDASVMRDKLIEKYKKITGKNEKICFRQILSETGKMLKDNQGKETMDIDVDMLIAGCNIFEALIIKNFRSADEFDKMMVAKKDKR